MNANEQATDGLALQEFESLTACIGRGQEPATYADVLEKLRGHVAKLPEERRQFWAAQCKELSIELIPPPPPPEAPPVPQEPPKRVRKAKDE